jgi:hypothetical protein
LKGAKKDRKGSDLRDKMRQGKGNREEENTERKDGQSS